MHVIGQSLRASPQLAALANGVANHAMDYDFSLLNGQSAAPVIPALLPLAELTNATPADVLGAFIIGCEVATRLLRSSPRMINDGGWHSTGVIGVIAATAACAKLLKLPVDKTAESLGIAASLASGLPVNYGTMTKPLHAGNAARNAVMAATLAGRGFTSHAGRVRRQQRLSTAISPARCRRTTVRSRISAAAGTSPRSATTSNITPAADAATPRSRRR